jgi:hypothetical protein
MPGPYKPWNETVVGDYVQRNYNFLDQMFSEGNGLGPTRQRYLGYTGHQLRQNINTDLHILIPPSVKVGVFDCETVAFNDPDHIAYGSDEYYILVLPPTPRGVPIPPFPPANPPSQDHTDDQAWDSAWYHAIVDGYGM